MNRKMVSTVSGKFTSEQDIDFVQTGSAVLGKHGRSDEEDNLVDEELDASEQEDRADGQNKKTRTRKRTQGTSPSFSIIRLTSC